MAHSVFWLIIYRVGIEVNNKSPGRTSNGRHYAALVPLPWWPDSHCGATPPTILLRSVSARRKIYWLTATAVTPTSFYYARPDDGSYAINALFMKKYYSILTGI